MPKLWPCFGCFDLTIDSSRPNADAVLSTPGGLLHATGDTTSRSKGTVIHKKAINSWATAEQQVKAVHTLQSKLFEALPGTPGCLPARLCRIVKESLGVSVVRLYGMDTSAEAGDAGRLVLLAGCCSRCGDDGVCGSSSCSACLLLLGWSVAAPEGPVEGPPPGTRMEAGTAMEWDRWRGMESTELDLASAPLLLLQLAVTSKVPASYSLAPSHADESGAAAAAASAPADVLLDADTYDSRLFAAVPLHCGGGTFAVLWISGPEDVDLAATVLRSTTTLQQIGVWASMALAAALAGADGSGGGGSDPGIAISWLSGALRRVAGSNSLQGFIRELCGTLVAHVRRQYLLDTAIQAALVPIDGGSGSDAGGDGDTPSNGFMLYPEGPTSLPLQLGLCSALYSSGVKLSGCSALLVALGGGSVVADASVTALSRKTSQVLNWVAPQTLAKMNAARSQAMDRLPRQHLPQLQQPQQEQSQRVDRPRRSISLGTIPLPTDPSTESRIQQSPRHRQLSSNSQQQKHQLLLSRMGSKGVAVARMAAAVTASTSQRPISMVIPLLAEAELSSPDIALLRGNSRPQLPLPRLPALRAKAFQLSSTLLQRMASDAYRGSGAQLSNVISGPIVADCARWVQDVRQPSRDVYILMASGGGTIRLPFAVDTAAAGNEAGAAEVDGSHGAGLRSLVLVGLRTSAPPVTDSVAAAATGGSGGGDGDGMESLLGMYLTFNTRLPIRLLEAISRSCCSLLDQFGFAQAARARLMSDLASELATVRAGVPGEYAVLPSSSPAVTQSLSQNLGANQSIQFSASHTFVTSNDAPMAPADAAPLLPCRLAQSNRLDNRLSLSSNDAAAALTVEATLSGLGTPRPGDAATIDTASLLLTDVVYTDQQGHPRPHTQTQTCQSVVPLDASSSSVMMYLGGESQANGAAAVAAYPADRHTGELMLPPRLRTRSQAPPISPQPHEGIMAHSRSRRHAINPGGGDDDVSRDPSPTVRRPLQGLTVAFPLEPPTPLLTASYTSTHNHIHDRETTGESALFDTTCLTSLLTVHEADCSSSLLTHMGLLVDAISVSLQTNTSLLATNNSMRAAPVQTNANVIASRTHLAGRNLEGCDETNASDDDLGELQLHEIIGEGASGVVLAGVLGTTPVAVKLIEMPDAELLELPLGLHRKKRDVLPAPDYKSPPEAAQKLQQQEQKQPGLGAGAVSSSTQLDARRNMLRNAMELAVLKSVSHVNIIQCHAVFDNVRLEKMVPGHAGRPWTCVLRRDTDTTGTPREGPLCTALVMELCSCGSLAGVLSDRSFPKVVSSSKASSGGGSGGMEVRIKMQGIYMTLLEIALALRHLHARRLVHRDLKPANVLLCASPTDPRGWTCKLADFGFTLLLDCQSDTTPGPTGMVSVDPLVVASTGGNSSGGASAMHLPQSQPQPNKWFTVQDEACGTVTHMAPEAIKRNSRIDASVDIFSFGIIMWELLCGRGNRPYRKLSPEEIPWAVLTGLRPVFPEEVPVQYRRLAQACWSADPASRPCAADLVLAIKGFMGVRAGQQQQQWGGSSGGKRNMGAGNSSGGRP